MGRLPRTQRLVYVCPECGAEYGSSAGLVGHCGRSHGRILSHDEKRPFRKDYFEAELDLNGGESMAELKKVGAAKPKELALCENCDYVFTEKNKYCPECGTGPIEWPEEE